MSEAMTDRARRLAETEGMPIFTIIELKLVTRADWEDVAGAIYPVQREWKKRKDGSLYFTGRCGTNRALTGGDLDETASVADKNRRDSYLAGLRELRG